MGSLLKGFAIVLYKLLQRVDFDVISLNVMQIFRSRLRCNLLLVISGFILFTRISMATEANGEDPLSGMNLEELLNIEVSVASKRLQDITDAPGVINVITAEEIERYGSLNLLQILARLPGFYQLDESVESHSNVSIRGQSPSKSGEARVLYLINGRPFRELSSGFNEGILRSFPLKTIQHIEIIRGPGSTIYGTNAYSGVVNVVTKKTDESDNQFAVGYGSFNSKRIDGSFGLERGKLQLSGGLTGLKSDGWRYNSYSGNLIAGFSETSAKLPNHNYGLHMQAQYGDLTINGTKTYNDYKNFQGQDIFNEQLFHDMYDIGYVYSLSENWGVTANLTYTEHLWQVSESDSSNIRGESEEIRTEVALMGTIYERFNVLFGGAYYDIDGFQTAPRDYGVRNKSSYLQLDYELTSQLSLIAGVQYNKPNYIGSDTSPRLGAIFNINPNWGAKLLYSEAFRSANTGERLANIPGFVVGDANLEPEEIATVDLHVFYRSDRSYAALTVFDSEATNGIAFAPNPSAEGVIFANIDDVDYHGAELEGRHQLNQQWHWQGSVSYTEHENQSGERDLFGQPNWMLKSGFDYSWGDLSFGIFATYHDEPATTTSVLAQDLNPNPDDYTILTANIRYDISPWVKIKDTYFVIYGDNLLDESVYRYVSTVTTINSMPVRRGRGIYGAIECIF